MRFEAIALDYDRTLTTPELEPVPEALLALEAARDAGLHIVILSGRSLDFLEEHLGEYADAIVAENGALLRLPDGTVRELATPLAIPTLTIAHERGRLIASVDVADAVALRRALADAGVDAELVRNRDRVMALPRGISKATGLAAALAVLGVDASRCVAFGDGENDAPMLLAAGHGVAVANAAEELKGIASEVTARAGGLGVADWLHANLARLGAEAA